MPQGGTKRNAKGNNRHGRGTVPDSTELALADVPIRLRCPSWPQASNEGSRIEWASCGHFTRRFGECWTLRPNPARCFGARSIISVAKAEVVNTSRSAAGRSLASLAAAQPIGRAVRSTPPIDQGARKRRSLSPQSPSRDSSMRGRRASARTPAIARPSPAASPKPWVPAEPAGPAPTRLRLAGPCFLGRKGRRRPAPCRSAQGRNVLFAPQ
jgi:hypothetical protein